MTLETITQRNTEFHALIADSRITGFKRLDIERTGVRVYRNGCIGIAGTTGIANLSNLQTRAIKALERGITYPCEPSINRNEHVVLGNDLMPTSLFAEQCERLLATLRTEFPAFVFSHILKMVERDRSIKNDQGLDLAFRDRFYDLTLLYKKLGSTDIVDGSISILSRGGAFDAFLAQARETLPAFLREEKLPSGSQLPVIWLELDCAPLEIFSRELWSRSFGTGNSLFAGKVGQRLFAPHCTLVQDNTSMLTPGTPFFDAEGVVNSGFSLPLIENGVLRSPYSDKRTACEFNLKVTGSAASAHDGAPSATGFFPRLQSTHASLRDILKGQNGIFIMTAGGGDYDSVGRFGSPVQSAFLHDGEKLVARLPEFQISGDMDNLFGKNLRGVCHNSSFPGSLGGYVVMDMEVARV